MGDTMLAAVFKGNGRLELEQRPVPKVREDTDVILQVGAVGICGTDLHMLDVPPKLTGKVGIIMGHEFSGRVTEVGKTVKMVKPGDHVAIDPNPPCGMCENCRSGLPNACIPHFENEVCPGMPLTPGLYWDGGYAEYVRIPHHFCYRVDKSLPFWKVSLVEPLACAVSCMKKVSFMPGETAVVLGAGPIGLFFVGLLKASGALKVIVSEPAPVRARLAAACGADVIINPNKENVKDRVMAETEGKGAEVVIEAVGWLFPLCIELARTGGRIILFGVDTTARAEIDTTPIISKELQIYGGFLTKYVMPLALRILQSGLLPVEKIVSHKMPLQKIHEGIALTRTGEGVKVMLIPNEI